MDTVESASDAALASDGSAELIKEAVVALRAWEPDKDLSSKELAPLKAKTGSGGGGVCIDLRVPRREYHYFRKWGVAEVEAVWPCSDTGCTRQDHENLVSDLQRFYKQPHREQGDHVVVTECYRPPKSGFPGRLNSAGCQGLVRAIRSNLLKETADLDMNNAMPRCIVWWCKQFGVPATRWKHYVDHRDGPDGMLQRVVDETGVSKGMAKQQAIIFLTDGRACRTSRSPYLKKLDAEAKAIQAALMARPELRWILPYCKRDNREGSFMSHLYHFIENRLLMRVHRMLVEERRVAVAALVFDGLNVMDKSKHGDQAILDRAHAVCEEVAPGIDMPWSWKGLDFVLESKEKRPLANGDGGVRELRVPESYRPARKRGSEVAEIDADYMRL